MASISTASRKTEAHAPGAPVLKSVPRGLEVPPLSPQAVEDTFERARAALLNRQNPQGYWVGELQGDSILESEYILMKFILSQENAPELPRIANYLRSLQRPGGGWSLFPGGADDLSGTVKGYFALKLIGDHVDAPHMVAARRIIRDLGGRRKVQQLHPFLSRRPGPDQLRRLSEHPAGDHAPAAVDVLQSLRRLRLDAHDDHPADHCQHAPPDAQTHRIARHRRAFRRPRRARKPHRAVQSPPQSWRDLFQLLDLSLKQYEKIPVSVLRKKPCEAERWLLDHTEGSEGLGPIFPPMVYILIALRALGYPDDHPKVIEAHNHLRGLFLEEGDTIRVQPCHSPVWDTGLALHGLAESGLDADTDAARRASQWLLAKECRTPADWAVHCPDVEPSGWYFEFANPHYPDVDDTAMVTVALKRCGGPAAEAAVSAASTG